MARVSKFEVIPTQERVSILETKVEVIDEKIDDLKADVKDMHDCLDNTRDTIYIKLDGMLEEYRTSRDKFYAHADKMHEEHTVQHDQLASKLQELEQFKNKWTYLVLGGAAVIGWLSAYWETVVKILE